jgi:hypothetical protein
MTAAVIACTAVLLICYYAWYLVALICNLKMICK